MRVEAIHIRAPHSADMRSVPAVKAIAGKGLKEDRYFFPSGAKPGDALTLIEKQVVEEVGLGPGESCRQLTISGTGLNGLVGKRFRIGVVECRGVRLCEPCLDLERRTKPGLIKALVHRGGLNADILTEGWIRVGDEVEALGSSPSDAQQP